MTTVGAIHTTLGLAALVLGLVVAVRPKATLLHRRVGQAYVVALLTVNFTAFFIYRLTGRFGPFHIAALVSLVTVGTGYVTVYLRRPPRWLAFHAYFMAWSYVSLLAAFASEIAVRSGFVPMRWVYAVSAAVTAVVAISGALVISVRVPRAVRNLGTWSPSLSRPIRLFISK